MEYEGSCNHVFYVKFLKTTKVKNFFKKISELATIIPPTSTVDRDHIESLVATNLRWHQRNFEELQEFYSNYNKL